MLLPFSFSFDSQNADDFQHYAMLSQPREPVAEIPSSDMDFAWADDGPAGPAGNFTLAGGARAPPASYSVDRMAAAATTAAAAPTAGTKKRARTLELDADGDEDEFADEGFRNPVLPGQRRFGRNGPRRRYNTSDIEVCYGSQNSELEAEQTIVEAIENGNAIIDLYSRGLREVPENIEQLNNIVLPFLPERSESLVPKLTLWLYDNKITTLAPGLFQLSNLTVLSLRQNQIAEIPPAISRLGNLVELNLAGNMIRQLPASLLRLKHLRNLYVWPNPLLENPKPLPTPPSSQASRQVRLLYSALHDDDAVCSSGGVGSGGGVPSLGEYARRALRAQKIHPREVQGLGLTEHLVHSIALSYMAQAYDLRCDFCDRAMVVPAVQVNEWWDGFCGRADLPIIRRLCSGHCYRANVHSTGASARPC